MVAKATCLNFTERNMGAASFDYPHLREDPGGAGADLMPDVPYRTKALHGCGLCARSVTSVFAHGHLATGSQLVLQQLHVPTPQSARFVHCPWKANMVALRICFLGSRLVHRVRSSTDKAARDSVRGATGSAAVICDTAPITAIVAHNINIAFKSFDMTLFPSRGVTG